MNVVTTAEPALQELRGKDDWTGVIPRPPLRLPRTPRALFELLSLYEPGEALEEFLLRLDCDMLSVSDVNRMLFGAVPGDPAQWFPQPGFDARRHMAGELLSDRFRAELLGRFLAAFPEKRRDVFIHVPKTAGTDLTLNVWPRRVSLPLSLPVTGSNLDALRYVALLARHMPATDDIFVHGHMPLGRYLAIAGARLGDRIFTTVREPVDLLISQVSDLMNQFLLDTEAAHDNTRRWLRFLGLDRVPTSPSPSEMKELWAAGLLNPKIAEPNNICTFLAQPEHPTYESAMTNVVAYNVEVTTTARYSRWMAERWGVASSTRHNASRRMLDSREVERFFYDRLGGQIGEDEKFFAVVDWVLSEGAAASVTGREIAERVGPRLLSGFAEELVLRRREDLHVARHRGAWAVRGPWAVNAIQELLPERLTGRPTNVLQTLVFGKGGNAQSALRDGWSPPGNGGTWSESDQAHLTLRAAAPGGLLVLQIRLRPFVYPHLLPRQRVGIAVNGHEIGEVTLSDISAIDCVVPPQALDAAAALDVTFSFPDAHISTQTPERQHDPRHLGCFFENLRLIRYAAEDGGGYLLPTEPDGVVCYDRVPYLEMPGAAGVEAPGMDVPLLGLAFGHEGDAEAHQDGGFSRGEHGFTWTNAPRARLRLARPEQPGRYLLRAHVRPYVVAERLAAQRVFVDVNGQPVGEARLTGPTVLDCRMSWPTLAEADPLMVQFTMPDAARPSDIAGHPNDTRQLGIAFQRLWLIGPLPPLPDAAAPPPAAAATQPDPGEHAPVPEPERPEPMAAAAAPAASVAAEPAPAEPAPVEPARAEAAPTEPAPVEPAPAEPPVAAPAVIVPATAGPRRRKRQPLPPPKLMLHFESLGENCEFGLVQRQNGAEPLGLFRFASAPLPKLLRALRGRFAGMGAAEDLEVEISPNGREYMVFDKRFEFRYHAWVNVEEKTPEEVLAREVKRVPFLVDKLIADLTEGAKIFVYHSVTPISPRDAAGLARAIRGYGPGSLLWMTLADAEHPPGSVERLGDGLLQGRMDRFAPPENAHDLSLDCWNQVCGAALLALTDRAGR